MSQTELKNTPCTNVTVDTAEIKNNIGTVKNYNNYTM